MNKRTLNLKTPRSSITVVAFTLSCASFLLLGASVASAHDDKRPVRPRVQATYTEQALMKIRRMEARQLQQVQTGVRNGALTFKEANRINRKMEKVERAVKRYMRDHRLRAFEARKIGRMQVLVTKEIRKLSNNRVARFGYLRSKPVRPMMRPHPRKPMPRATAPRPAGPRPVGVGPGKLKAKKVKGHKPMLPAHVSL